MRRRALTSAARSTATDTDQGDTLTYALGGADAASFTIVAASGQIRTSATLDYDTKASYTVAVTATDDGTVDSVPITVTINVTQVVVADYDCARGAVADQANTGLVRDCEALLSARNKLEGNARLNWSDVAPIAGWEGITLRGTPERVAWVDLRAKGLSGTVPAELGQLSMLTYLNLRSNNLTGSVPDELGRLTNLQKLLLHDNGLSGGFPNLRGLRNLTHLWLSGANHSVGAGGGVPTWLNGLTNLVELNLWGNELGGTIPNLSGLTSLKLLKLQNNSLTGSIPTWFGNMNRLSGLYLHNNDLTGSIPSQLGQLTTLRRLWIDRNDLTGDNPAGAGQHVQSRHPEPAYEPVNGEYTDGTRKPEQVAALWAPQQPADGNDSKTVGGSGRIDAALGVDQQPDWVYTRRVGYAGQAKVAEPAHEPAERGGPVAAGRPGRHPDQPAARGRRGVKGQHGVDGVRAAVLGGRDRRHRPQQRGQRGPVDLPIG